MPQRKAAKKDLKKNQKRHLQNLTLKKRIKAAIKNFKKSLENNDTAAGKSALQEIQKALDSAVSKKMIHKNKAARKKSRLSKVLKKPASHQAG